MEDHLADQQPAHCAVERIAELNVQSWNVSQSNPRGALRLALEALNVCDDADCPDGRATANLNAGWALVNLGRYDTAVGHLTIAREQYAGPGDREGIMKATNALGVLSLRIGEFDQAREFLDESLRIAEEQRNTVRTIAALNNLGELACATGDYRPALAHFARAARLAESVGDEGVQAVIRVNLGRVYLEQGRQEAAVDELQVALEQAAVAGDRITEAEAMTQLARALVIGARGLDPDGTAEELHLQSIALCEQTDHPAGVILGLENLAALLIAAGRLDEAETHLRTAVAIARDTDAPITTISVIEELSAQYEEAGDPNQALAIARWLLALHDEHIGADTGRLVRTVRARHELDQARMETEVVRLRNVELREKSEELERSNSTLQLLHRIGSELTGTLDLEEIARRLHDRVNELMSADVFGVAFYREADQTLDYALVIEDDQRITPFSVPVSSEDSFGSWVIRNRREICLNDADRLHKQYVKHRKPFTARNCRSIVYLPLEIEGRIIGVLTVQSHRRNVYGNDTMNVLRLLSPYIAVALDNSRKLGMIQALNHELEREKRQLEEAYRRIAYMANHDILTQLPNRRLFVELIHEYIPLARRQSKIFGLLYVDLDDFKPINDTFGHDAGDRVLVRIADRLRSALRESDTVARIGGDEFVVIVREAGKPADVIAVAQKVLEAVQQPVAIGDQACHIAASIGVSLYPQHGESYDELLNAADDAMYRTKQSGKSGISMADQRSFTSVTSISDQSSVSSSNTNRPTT